MINNNIITLPGKIRAEQVEGLPINYSRQYLTTESLESGNISFNIWAAMGTDYITSISYSTDNGKTWITTNNTNNKEENLVIEVEVNEGDKVLWKGNAQQTGYYGKDIDNYAGSFFSSDCEFNAYGNVMSMLYEDDFYDKNEIINEGCFSCLFNDYDKSLSCLLISAEHLVLPATTLTSCCYKYMFYGCTSLVNAPELPAIRLGNYCYCGMFSGCTSLVNAPELPAIRLGNYCYQYMFEGCTSLSNAPELPATTLANYCYAEMFYGCTSLVNAPELPANTLAQSCYGNMFNGCTSLKYIKCLATDISATNCLKNWVKNVAASGTFIKNDYMSSWTTGNSGIPSGWIVKNNSDIENITGEDLSKYKLEVEYIKQYLTIVSLEDNNTIGWKASDNSLLKTISISTDGGTTWVEKTSSTSGTTLATLNTGYKLLIKGSNMAYSTDFYKNQFISTGNFNVEGNIMSLIYNDNFIQQNTLDSSGSNFRGLFYNCNRLISVEHLVLPAPILADNCYQSMFWKCTSLVNAPELPATRLGNYCYQYMFSECTSLVNAPELPAIRLGNYCYQYMFSGCTSLVNAPKLPVTTLFEGCYAEMFIDCTSLVNAPELPATTLTESCYSYMFSGCTSLVNAPELPANTLTDYCYIQMFAGCTSLKYIKCLATDISATDCLKNWVTYVNKTVVFIKNDSMNDWTVSYDVLPANFIIYKESEYNLAHIYDIDNKLYLPSDYTPSGSDYGCGDYYPLLNDSLYSAISKLHKCILDVEYLYNNLDQRLSMIEVTATPTQTDSQGYEEISNTTTATPTSNEVDEYGNTPTPTQIPGFEEGCSCSS